MTYKLHANDRVPTFQAADQNGKEWTEKDLQGKITVIYFYPKDETPGCTKQACSFRDNLESLTKENVHILGVSPDSAKSHQKFASNHNLNFTLLADPEKDLCQKFDVLQPKVIYGKQTIGVERSTFLVDGKGIIRWIERPVSLDGQIDRILEAVRAL